MCLVSLFVVFNLNLTQPQLAFTRLCHSKRDLVYELPRPIKQQFHYNRTGALHLQRFARLSFFWHITVEKKQSHILTCTGSKMHSSNTFGWLMCFLMDRRAEKWRKCQVPTLTLDLSISAVVERLASRDWGSVWSWSVKTYTPTESQKMKDIFSLSSTSHNLTFTVRPKCNVQNLQYLSVSKKSAYSLAI